MSLFTDIENALNSKELREGWCTVEKAHVLASCIVCTRPDIIIEIGVWAGRSLIPMAMACKHINHGVVIGIDPWDRDAACEGLTGANLEWWTKVAPYEWIYGEFKKAIEHFGVKDYVQVYRCKSDDFEPPAIDLLHIDGSHTEQAMKDVSRFCPKVSLGGFLFMDDVEWITGSTGNILDVIQEMGFRHNVRFNTGTDTGALFQRLKV